MRIQPIDSIQNDDVKLPPVLKSRLKRLFDRPFNSVLKISSAEKPSAGETNGVPAIEFEPSSVCLDKMVRNFIEDSNHEKHSAATKCGRNRCNCFNGNINDSSDDELDFFSDSLSAKSSFPDASDTLKSLIPCGSLVERNLLADTSRFFEKNNKLFKRKDDLRKILADGLMARGYNASVCKSKWEKSSSIPAGEYEYIDVIIEGERLLVDVDFRSEFEIARSTSSYKAILQCLPQIFVGKSDRLLQIVSIVSEAARQSLKKKGMHLPPWRKSEYMKSKWLAPHTRTTQLTTVTHQSSAVEEGTGEALRSGIKSENEKILQCEVAELDLIFGEKTSPLEMSPAVMWQPPAVRPKSLERGSKVVVTGLASLLKEQF